MTGVQTCALPISIAFRIGSFEEVNKGYTGRQARMEAERCLRCDVKCEEEELYG